MIQPILFTKDRLMATIFTGKEDWWFQEDTSIKETFIFKKNKE